MAEKKAKTDKATTVEDVMETITALLKDSPPTELILKMGRKVAKDLNRRVFDLAEQERWVEAVNEAEEAMRFWKGFCLFALTEARKSGTLMETPDGEGLYTVMMTDEDGNARPVDLDSLPDEIREKVQHAVDQGMDHLDKHMDDKGRVPIDLDALDSDVPAAKRRPNEGGYL